jgi:hypothetical protein
MACRIELTIDELVLEGFHSFDKTTLRMHLEEELTKFFNTPGVPDRFKKDRDLPLIKPGSLNLAPNASPVSISKGIGKSIIKGLTS